MIRLEIRLTLANISPSAILAKSGGKLSMYAEPVHTRISARLMIESSSVSPAFLPKKAKRHRRLPPT